MPKLSTCSLCGATFTNKSELEAHAASHGSFVFRNIGPHPRASSGRDHGASGLTIASSPLARYSITTPAAAAAAPFPAPATHPAMATVSGELPGNKKTAKRKRKLPPSVHYSIREAD